MMNTAYTVCLPSAKSLAKCGYFEKGWIAKTAAKKKKKKSERIQRNNTESVIQPASHIRRN